MPNPNTNITEIVVTTLRRRRKKLADNMSAHIPLLKRMSENGNADPAPGGRTLVEELEYAENSTFKYYSGHEVLDITPSEVFTFAEFDWKQAAVVVGASGLELAQNSGEDATIKLLDSRIRNAERTLMNNLATGIASDGTGSGGKQIGGLQLLVADDPTTGTVGGISRASYSFWRNKIFDFSANSLTPSSSTIQQAMDTLWLNTCRNADKVDLIVAGTTYFTYYWQSLQAIQRISDESKGGAGFRTIKFMGPSGSADCVYDGTISATRMYFLNTKYLFWRPHTDRDMEPLSRREPTNQDAVVVPIVWMGNLTMSNAALQGVIIP